ncbi:hypothetical protein [Escherichia sp. E13S3]|uniref:hypothetical protein n=1 Tax=Escherichia sp. E13S3 TaxID=2484854 RepID=UPI001029B896|nr:hypothetical protein [Escherichia sp. E13S3]RZN48088.1 hypothetical protein D9597_13775 [Escherichia sp. E13S3]
MKKWIKELLERFQLTHIRWMLIGILLTEFITWVLYKNPKKITAPGLSSIVAVCALCLAIYSAYQVKKWLNGKINEKGFKKCEAVIDSTQAIALEMLKVNPEIGKLFRMDLIILNSEQYNSTVEKLTSSIAKLDELTLEANTHGMHLNIWGFEIAEDFNLLVLAKAIRTYNVSIRTTIENSKKAREIGEYKEIEEDKTAYFKALNLVGNYMDKLNDSSFEDVFIEYRKE